MCDQWQCCCTQQHCCVQNVHNKIVLQRAVEYNAHTTSHRRYGEVWGTQEVWGGAGHTGGVGRCGAHSASELDNDRNTISYKYGNNCTKCCLCASEWPLSPPACAEWSSLASPGPWHACWLCPSPPGGWVGGYHCHSPSPPCWSPETALQRHK